MKLKLAYNSFETLVPSGWGTVESHESLHYLDLTSNVLAVKCVCFETLYENACIRDIILDDNVLGSWANKG